MTDNKLWEINDNEELKEYLSVLGDKATPYKGLFCYTQHSANCASNGIINSEEYGNILGLKGNFIFPDEKTKTIIEKIALYDFANKSCMDIAKKENVPWILIVSYKSFLLHTISKTELEEEKEFKIEDIMNDEIMDDNSNKTGIYLIDIYNDIMKDSCYYCTEKLEGLVELCEPEPVLY